MTQTLANRMMTDSDAVFASCAVLPIHQTTLNAQEMAGIDGLWDREEFNNAVWNGAIAGTLVGAATGAAAGVGVGGVGAIPGLITGAALGYIGGVLGGAIGYTLAELTSDESEPPEGCCACTCG